MRDYIIYFGRFELPDKNALAHRVRANAISLSKSGYKVILVGYNRTQNKEFDKMPIGCDDFECYALKYPAKSYRWFFDNAYKHIKELVAKKGSESIAAIIFTGIGYINMKAVISLCAEKEIPFVYDVVDWFPYKKLFSFRNALKRAEEWLIRRNLLPKVHNCIFISEYLDKYYLPYEVNSIVIPSLTYNDDERFVDLPFYRPSEEIVYCYAGNPGRKGSKDRIDWCISAFGSLPSEKSKMFVYDLTEKEFSSDFPNIKINNNIKFMGKCMNEVCLRAIAQADFFVFAREDTQITRAGFPTKLSESLAIGTPVITTPSSDIKRYVFNWDNGFVSDECNYESFSKAFLLSHNTNSNDRMKMHYKKSRLDEANWRDDLSSFIKSLQ